MKFYIVIPAHNESAYISDMLQSLVDQSLRPTKVVVVNDNSSDTTFDIVTSFSETYDFISTINNTSSNKHIPGSKVINAFYKGYNSLDENYDVICKFDADIILPKNYLEKLSQIFNSDPKVGIAGGLAYIKKNNNWVYENIASKQHVRGPFKAYRKACFKAIGGLKISIGWDTVDTLLAQYYNWTMVADSTLIVKHLKPTGATYNKASQHLQGEALYKMRYGIFISCISALKMAFKKKNIKIFIDYMLGYYNAKREQYPYLVNEDEGKFIRQFRLKGFKKALGF